jgi:tripartite ATP-independent transporter DctM subunit
MLSVLMTVIFLVLLMLRVPISMAIGLSTLVPLTILGRNLIVMPQMMMQAVQSPALLAVPFFILAGSLFSVLGLSRRIWDFAQAAVGHVRGGLGHVMVVAVMIFSGISGSALADIAALGIIGIPQMERNGYRKRFAAAVTLAAAVIGPMFPPSINLIIYGIVAQVSIGRLFLGGIIPGIIIGFSLIATIYLAARLGFEPCPVQPRPPLGEVGRLTLRALPTLVVPVVIIMGMGFGLITPTETGVFAAAYALMLGAFYREADWKRLWETVTGSTRTSINIMFIIAVSTIAGWIYTYDGTSQHLTGWLFGLTQDRNLILLLVNVLLLLLGCFLEPIPLMILTVPIVLPVMTALGVDPVHFGIVMSLNMTIGIVHPPVGIGLYVMTGVAKVSYEELVIATLPFLVPLILCLLLFTYAPALTLWLPGLVMG